MSLGYRTGGKLPLMRRPRAVAAAALLLLAAAIVVVPASSDAQDTSHELRVAAAADLSPVMPVLAQRFERASGVKLIVTTGSSGTLSQQILNGAPVDIFLGADFVYPEKIVAAGLTDGKAPTAYANGTLVLWARKNSPAQPLSMDRLDVPQVARIAVADKFHAPFGRAATDALDRMRLTDKLRGKLVTAENVAQAGQFAESGNAQAAFISLTLATSQHYKDVGTYVLVPASMYPEIRQCAVVLTRGRKDQAHVFLDWLLSTPVQQDLPKVGLEPVR